MALRSLRCRLRVACAGWLGRGVSRCGGAAGCGASRPALRTRCLLRPRHETRATVTIHNNECRIGVVGQFDLGGKRRGYGAARIRCRAMWPVYAWVGVAAVALAAGLVLASARELRAARWCAVIIAVSGLLAVVAYAEASFRYQSCVDGRYGLSEDATDAFAGYHFCYQRVFGSSAGPTAR